jgi:hypothetical protein
MKYLAIFCVALFLAGSGVSTAQAVVLFEDNFDSYADQAGFDAVWSVLPGTAAGVSYENVRLSQEQATSPTNSAKTPAQPTGATLLQRSSHDFTAQSLAAAGDKIVFSFDFYDSNAPAAAYREYAEIRSSGFASSTNQLIAIGLNNTQTESASGGPAYMGRILGYTPSTVADPDGGPAESASSSGSFFKLNDFAMGARSLGWHNLKVEISTSDLLSTDYKFYVDNNLAETVSDVGSASSIRSYERIVLGSALTNGDNAAYFDNVRVEFIPAAAANVQGDYNGNGVVDGADYVIWRKGVAPLPNEVPGVTDGITTPEDYDAWRARFGNTSGSGSGLGTAAVPEPTAVALLIIGVAALAADRRTSKSPRRRLVVLR